MPIHEAAAYVGEPEPAPGPRAPERAPAPAPAAPPAKAWAPAAPAPRSRVPVGLLLGVFGFTIGLLALFAWVAWQVLPDDMKRVGGAGPTPTATASATAPPAAAVQTPGWRDVDGVVEVPQPPDFTRGEAGARSIQFLGPPGTKFASSITVEVTGASAGATTASEHALVERSLAAELGSRFQRLSAGPLTVAGEPMMFLIYQRTTADGVLIQNWLVLGVKDGHRVAFRLTGEMAQWDRLRGLFGALLTQVRFPGGAGGDPAAAPGPPGPPPDGAPEAASPADAPATAP
jgi:hypothetical protein